MTRIFKLFYIVASISLSIRLTNGANNSPESDIVREPEGREHFEAPAVKMLKSLRDSHAVEKSKEAAAIAAQHLGKLAGDITEELNEISKNHSEDPNSNVQNLVKNYLWYPATAITKVGLNKIQVPINSFFSEVKHEYDTELKNTPEKESNEEPSEHITRKPVAIVKATSGVLKKRIGGLFENGLRFWRSRNKNKVMTEKHEE